MTWTEIFETAEGYTVTLDDIESVLEEMRSEDAQDT